MSDTVEVGLAKLIENINPNEKYSPDLDLTEDLNLDSLDIIGFLFEVEREFGIKISDQDVDSYKLFNIGNLYEYIKNCQ